MADVGPVSSLTARSPLLSSDRLYLDDGAGGDWSLAPSALAAYLSAQSQSSITVSGRVNSLEATSAFSIPSSLKGYSLPILIQVSNSPATNPSMNFMNYGSVGGVASVLNFAVAGGTSAAPTNSWTGGHAALCTYGYVGGGNNNFYQYSQIEFGGDAGYANPTALTDINGRIQFTIKKQNAWFGGLVVSWAGVIISNTLPFYQYNTGFAQTDNSATPTNYERFTCAWSSNAFNIGNEGGGTGVVRNLLFKAGTTQSMLLKAASRPCVAGFDVAGFDALTGTIYTRIYGDGATTGLLTIDDTASGSFTLVASAANVMGFGGKTTSFPGLTRSGATLQAKLADGSALTKFQAQLQAHANAVAETITPDHTIIIYDAAGTAYRVPCQV